MNKIILFFITFSLVLSSCNQSKKDTLNIGYEGENISQNASVVRDKHTKAATLDIKTNGQWTLYGGASVDDIDMNTPLLTGNGSGNFPINVPENSRYYFQLNTEKGKAILAEKHLPMEGGFNFRDLGGIRNTEGKYVKWGKIFRGDELHNLTESDLQYLSSIPLISIVDFRSPSEIEAAPDKNPSSLKENYAYSIEPGNLSDFAGMNFNNLRAGEMDSMMMQLNIQLVTDPRYIERYREFFNLLQNENDVPLLFHCTAGKDRTGMGAALVLSSLGVDEEVIYQDYLLSNQYLEEKYGKLKSEYPNLAALFGVKREFLQAGIEQIKKDHGSVEKYLTDVLNVDLEKMKNMYLY